MTDVRLGDLFAHIPTIALARLALQYIGFEGRKAWTKPPSTNVFPPAITRDRVWFYRKCFTFSGVEQPDDRMTRNVMQRCRSPATIDAILKQDDGVSVVTAMLPSIQDLVFGPIVGDSMLLLNYAEGNRMSLFDLTTREETRLHNYFGTCLSAEKISSDYWLFFFAEDGILPRKLLIMSSKTNMPVVEVERGGVRYLQAYACSAESIIVKTDMLRYYLFNFITSTWTYLGYCYFNACLTTFPALSLFVKQLQTGNGKIPNMTVHCAKSGEVVCALASSNHVLYTTSLRIDEDPRSDVVAAITDSGIVHVWNVTTGKMLAQMKCSENSDAISLVGGHSRLVVYEKEKETILLE